MWFTLILRLNMSFLLIICSLVYEVSTLGTSVYLYCILKPFFILAILNTYDQEPRKFWASSSTNLRIAFHFHTPACEWKQIVKITNVIHVSIKQASYPLENLVTEKKDDTHLH
ncbi:hypothetical protein CI102_4203 [Trichoderma harzianum]|nr:hypothetical protein CI102_4203 [Trichoderma harzianum]